MKENQIFFISKLDLKIQKKKKQIINQHAYSAPLKYSSEHKYWEISSSIVVWVIQKANNDFHFSVSIELYHCF